MTFDLESFSAAVEARSVTWSALGARWHLKPVSPNYGKPVVAGEFESVAWAGDMTIWITGEAELSVARLADGWIVNKHYDLAGPDDLKMALDELAALMLRGSAPGAAVTAWIKRG